MKRWIFNPSIVLGIVASLAVYATVAEIADFHLLGLRNPSTSVVEHRLNEFLFLWCAACSIVGWTLYFINRRPPREATVWPLVIIPLVAALWLGASAGWDAYQKFAYGPIKSTQPGFFLLDVVMPLFPIAFPLVLWATISLTLFMQAKIWRLPVTRGICPACEYNLTGNVTGVCPECGERVVIDQTVPRYYYKQRFVWLPELGEFPDAKARFDAEKKAMKECRRSPAVWLSWIVTVLAIVPFTRVVPDDLNALRWIAGPVGVMAFAVFWLYLRNLSRRSLRRQLESEPEE